ncbi:MAG: carboxypeptidase-like regulatory domain-containing protein [Planctomycetota bacterium]
MWLAVVLAACSSATEPSVGGAAVGSASVEGFLMEGSPVIFVDDPAHAPPGDVPVVGAEVRVLDISGEVIGTAESGPDGRFVVSGLPGGYVELEARTDPATASADATAVATAVPGHAIVVGKTYPVTRDAANLIALMGVPAGAMVLGTLQPLPAGVLVAPSGTAAGPARTTPAEEYLYLIDYGPHADHAHPQAYVFVDAQTGAVQKLENVNWPPSVNGEPFWLVEQQIFKIVGFDPDNVTLPVDPGLVATPTAEMVQFPTGRPQGPAPTVAAAPRLAGHNTDPASIFVILLQASADVYKIYDIERVRNLFKSAGVPDENIKRIASYLTNPRPRPGETVIAFEDTIFPQTLNAVNARIQERLEAGLHSTLVVYITSHGGDGSFQYHLNPKAGRQLGIFARNLKLKTTPACRVRVFLQFCGARAFANELRADFDTRPPEDRHDYVIYSACDVNESAHADKTGLYTTIGILDAGTLFTKKFVPMASISGGDVVGLLDPTRPTQIHPDLAEYFGGIELSSGDNAWDHPSALVNVNDPRWCRGAPIAVAGPPQAAIAERQVTLDGSGSSDPDGDPLTYEWLVVDFPAGGRPSLSDATAAKPVFTPTVPGTYKFQLTVSDGRDGSTSDSVTVTVLRQALLPATVSDGIPEGAVAWIAINGEIRHEDGPFALPGAPNPARLKVMHPVTGLPSGAHWAGPDICPADHLHGPFEGHSDPAPGPPATASACGHGVLVFLFAN